MIVHAAVPVVANPGDARDVAVVDLPTVRTAATIIHHGPMDDVEQSMQVLARWVEENGYRTDGFAREVYLDYCPDEPEKGVMELQLVVHRG